jgi:osmotically-inducible protein OsmY
MKPALTLIAIGTAAGAAYLFGTARGRRELKHATGVTKGAVGKVTPGHGLKDPDDVTLARKIETEIFRPTDAPKGGVSVDVQAGVAYLRGEVPTQEWIDRLGDEARKVSGVSGVKNLLHTPGTPTPTAEPRFLASEQFHNN